jgi:hypothetical protein
LAAEHDLIKKRRERIEALLLLMPSLDDVSDIPRKGTNLIIVANVNNKLYFRIFDGDGKPVHDTRLCRKTALSLQ